MPAAIRMRARLKDGVTSVRALITHPMETGRRKEADKVIPAHYIQKVIGEHKGKVVFEAHWGTGVSKNPFVGFAFRNAQVGDMVKLKWFDNMGKTGSTEIPVTQ